MKNLFFIFLVDMRSFKIKLYIFVALIRQNEKMLIYREKIKIGGDYVFPKN